jgi:hypothetical protein
MAQGALLLLVVGITSLAAGWTVRRRRPGRLADAVRLTLEMVGIATLFLVGNLALGLAIIWASGVTPIFVSVYVLNGGPGGAVGPRGVFFCWRRGRPD